MRWLVAMVSVAAMGLVGTGVRAEGMIAASESLASAMTRVAAKHAEPGEDHLIFQALGTPQAMEAAARGATSVFEAYPDCAARRPNLEYAIAPAMGGSVVVVRFASGRPAACPRAAAALVGDDGSAGVLGGLDVDEVPER